MLLEALVAQAWKSRDQQPVTAAATVGQKKKTPATFHKTELGIIALLNVCSHLLET